MTESLSTFRANSLAFLCVAALCMFAVATATAARPPIDENQLLELGFKALVATTKFRRSG